MPCNTIQLSQVDLNLANPEVLQAAIEKLGGQAMQGGKRFYLDGQSYSIEGGKLQGDARTVGETADKVRRAYSQEVVDRAARRFGWMKKQTGQKLTLTRKG